MVHDKAFTWANHLTVSFLFFQEPLYMMRMSTYLFRHLRDCKSWYYVRSLTFKLTFDNRLKRTASAFSNLPNISFSSKAGKKEPSQSLANTANSSSSRVNKLNLWAHLKIILPSVSVNGSPHKYSNSCKWQISFGCGTDVL